MPLEVSADVFQSLQITGDRSIFFSIGKECRFRYTVCHYLARLSTKNICRLDLGQDTFLRKYFGE